VNPPSRGPGSDELRNPMCARNVWYLVGMCLVLVLVLVFVFVPFANAFVLCSACVLVFVGVLVLCAQELVT
jgi:hypothetical protein